MRQLWYLPLYGEVVELERLMPAPRCPSSDCLCPRCLDRDCVGCGAYVTDGWTEIDSVGNHCDQCLAEQGATPA